jgi:DNA ligase-1
MGKLKRWEDSEGIVTDFDELHKNTNKPLLDERGYTKRSSHQDQMLPMATLGALVLKDRSKDWIVRVGSGFTAQERLEIWANKEKYLGKIHKYKFLPHGTHDVARHPVSLGWRHPDDTEPDTTG